MDVSLFSGKHADLLLLFLPKQILTSSDIRKRRRRWWCLEGQERKQGITVFHVYRLCPVSRQLLGRQSAPSVTISDDENVLLPSGLLWLAGSDRNQPSGGRQRLSLKG